MTYTNSWLADGYYSITVANYELIRLIRVVSQISTYCQKDFISKFYLILSNSKIPSDVTEAKKIDGNK